MTYHLRKRLFELPNPYWIRDSRGHASLRADTSNLDPGDRIVLFDRAGRRLSAVRDKVVAGEVFHEIQYGNDSAGALARSRVNPSRMRFLLDATGPDDLEVVGDLSGLEYGFYRGDERVGSVTCRSIATGDGYTLDVAPHEDEVLLISAAIAVELAFEPAKPVPPAPSGVARTRTTEPIVHDRHVPEPRIDPPAKKAVLERRTDTKSRFDLPKTRSGSRKSSVKR